MQEKLADLREHMPLHKKLQAGQWAGQLLSYVTAPGGLVLFRKFMPGSFRKVSDTLKRYFIVPYFGMFEPMINAILVDDEHKESWKGMKTKPVTERAEFIADNLSKYFIGAALSIGTSLGAKKATDKLLAGESNWGLILKSTGVDTGVRVGAIAVISTALNRPANRLTHTLSRILQKMGMSKEHADDAASTTLFVGVPDTVGFFAGNRYLATIGKNEAEAIARG